jgi:hypothetical protein
MTRLRRSPLFTIYAVEGSPHSRASRGIITTRKKDWAVGFDVAARRRIKHGRNRHTTYSFSRELIQPGTRIHPARSKPSQAQASQKPLRIHCARQPNQVPRDRLAPRKNPAVRAMNRSVRLPPRVTAEPKMTASTFLVWACPRARSMLLSMGQGLSAE